MASPDPITEDARDYNTAKRKFGQTEAGDNDISDVLETILTIVSTKNV